MRLERTIVLLAEALRQIELTEPKTLADYILITRIADALTYAKRLRDDRTEGKTDEHEWHLKKASSHYWA